MKRIQFYLVVLLLSIQASAQTINIIETTAWLESAAVKWTPFVGADSYNLYYTGGGQTDKKIDTQLIRSYGTYFRADVLGLAAGNYTIKVVPVTAGLEITASAATSSSITVKPHLREGFAFTNGIIPGAYNMDGTPKTGAKIIYITSATANTVVSDVIGSNGVGVPTTGLTNILTARGKGYDKVPLIIRMIGTVRDIDVSSLNAGTFLSFVGSNNTNKKIEYVTIEGVGEDATAYGYGFGFKRSNGIEVRNIGIMMFGDDGVGMDTDNSNNWIHNNDFFYGKPGSDADQVKGDGSIDMKYNSTNITISYNHFWDSGKVIGSGGTTGETSNLKISYHHNWFDHADSRCPRLHYVTAHVYNNYYDGVAKYSIGNTTETSAFVEANYFRNSGRPMMISGQGTDTYDSATGTYTLKGTFSGQAGGMTKAYNNKFDNSGPIVYYSVHPTQFDAYLATTRNEIVPPSVISFKGAWPYNNFDTDSTMYVSNPDSPDDAKTNVIAYAGRMNGGDFKWIFDNAIDDDNHDVNQPLKAAIVGYQSALVSAQGIIVTATQTLSSPSNNNQTVASDTAIDPIVFTWGGDATDAIVTGLPISGISFVKDALAKTITISGIPTAIVTYSIATIGVMGMPVTKSGTITLIGSTPSDEIHNYTLSGLTSSFYTIAGSLSTGKGTIVYNGLTLTQCMKMGSSTNITYTTTQDSTLILVFVEAAGTAKVDGTNYVAANGILTIPIAAGSHQILKGATTDNLFYMKTSYSLGLEQKDVAPKITLYPNPVTNNLYLSSSNQEVKKVMVYSLTGTLVKTITNVTEPIDLSNLHSGSYLVKIITDQGEFRQIVIKI